MLIVRGTILVYSSSLSPSLFSVSKSIHTYGSPHIATTGVAYLDRHPLYWMLYAGGGNGLEFGNFRSTKIRREASAATGIWGPLPYSPPPKHPPLPHLALLQSLSLSQTQALEMDAGKAVVSSRLRLYKYSRDLVTK